MVNYCVERKVISRIPTPDGEFQLYLYTNDQDDKEHLALVMGEVSGKEDVKVRIHSECYTGDVLGSLRCDCGEQLRFAMHKIAMAGEGVLIYLRQEGRGIGLLDKLRAYNLQDQGLDTVDANLALGHEADERDYTLAACILKDLGPRSVELMTNNPLKIEELLQAGVQVTQRLSLETTVTSHNVQYLFTKAQRMQHMLNLDHLFQQSMVPQKGRGNGAA
ncbi:MAG: GTP cyclohydrolase II [Chloroflexota bacterium]|nr:MAG: GTP cyclohydrolase II [Chloroflexota bacterium]